MKSAMFLIVGIVSMILFQGCATDIHAPEEANVPPEEKFGSFQQVQLEKTVIAPEYAGIGANQKAVNKIDVIMEEKLKAVFPKLNEENSGEGRVLLIKPYAEQIKFIGGAARVWVGAMAGSSAIILRVDYIDKATGKVIASPKFYGKSSAAAGGMSYGGNDNAMLHRVVTLVTEYSTQNR